MLGARHRERDVWQVPGEHDGGGGQSLRGRRQAQGGGAGLLCNAQGKHARMSYILQVQQGSGVRSPTTTGPALWPSGRLRRELAGQMKWLYIFYLYLAVGVSRSKLSI